MKESDIFYPLVSYFNQLGYEVFGEVLDCDVVVKKNKELIIVEMKLNFNIKLIIQAIDRFKYSDKVYIAIQKPAKFNRKKRLELKKLCTMLGLGIFIIDLNNKLVEIELLLESTNIHKIKQTKQKEIFKQLNDTKFNLNIGGVNQVKINTSYKEKCIYIACILTRCEIISAKQLKDEFNFSENIYNVLYKNYYNWFEKVQHGFYKLTDLGFEALDDERYYPIVYYYQNELDKHYSIKKKTL